MAKGNVELLLLPYVAAGDSLLKRIITELENEDWTHFRAAVAFARASANFPDLLEALAAFAKRGGHVHLTFGADIFGVEQSSSDYDAIEELLNRLEAEATAEIFLYTEAGTRTFHPKVYAFSNDQAALVAIGSSNWTAGGLVNNVEANALIAFDLGDGAAEEEFKKLVACFSDYWGEISE